MSGENKTLQETVATVMSEQAAPAPAPAETAETNEGMSAGAAPEETQSGGTPEYVAGIDISDLPEQDRAKLKPLLEKKGKLLEDGYNKKFQEVASFKKAQDDLTRAGLSVEEARDVLLKHIEQKRNPPQAVASEKKEAVRTLDKLIESSGYEQRPALEQLRKIIVEETSAPELRKEVDELKTIIRDLQGESVYSKRGKVEQYMSGLSDKYGVDIIEKYKDNFVDAHLNHKIPLERLLQSVVPLEELEQAILTRGKKPLTKEKKEAITSASSGVTSAQEQVDTSKLSLAGVLNHVLKTQK